jgi:hypothetical protein
MADDDVVTSLPYTIQENTYVREPDGPRGQIFLPRGLVDSCGFPRGRYGLDRLDAPDANVAPECCNTDANIM